MYLPPADVASEEEWRWLLDRVDVIEVIAPGGPDRQMPVVVPVHAVWDGTRFSCHFAANNPLWSALAESPRAMVSVHGDWTYVPAAWKAEPGQDPALGIPTSLYWSVQVEAEATVVDEPEDLASILRLLLDHFEQPGVSVADPVAAHGNRLPAIRGLRLVPSDVRAKIKVGGNQSPAVQAHIRSQLAARGRPSDARIVELMDQRGVGAAPAGL
jgi:transcriptional regulator